MAIRSFSFWVTPIKSHDAQKAAYVSSSPENPQNFLTDLLMVPLTGISLLGYFRTYALRSGSLFGLPDVLHADTL